MLQKENSKNINNSSRIGAMPGTTSSAVPGEEIGGMPTAGVGVSCSEALKEKHDGFPGTTLVAKVEWRERSFINKEDIRIIH